MTPRALEVHGMDHSMQSDVIVNKGKSPRGSNDTASLANMSDASKLSTARENILDLLWDLHGSGTELFAKEHCHSQSYSDDSLGQCIFWANID
jgi:hypothetical protein